MPTDLEALAGIWRAFAAESFAETSPLYARLALGVADDADILGLLGEAPAECHWPLPLLAAVHDLVLAEPAQPLAAVYRGASDADPVPLLLDLCRTRWDDLLATMTTRPIQTNECGRAALLGPALTWLARRSDRPFGVVDVGTSAGLTLLADRYRLEYGGHGATGPVGSPVTVACRITEGAPPIAPALPEPSRRIGIDRAPLDVTDDADRRWLQACVWPDSGRTARTAAALELARLHPPDVRRGDAVADLAATVADLADGDRAVVTTTWVAAYFDGPTRAGFGQALAAISHERPVAWISLEAPGVAAEVLAGAGAPAAGRPGATAAASPGASTVTGALLDRGRVEVHPLGTAHPHGVWLSWGAPPEPSLA